MKFFLPLLLAALCAAPAHAQTLSVDLGAQNQSSGLSVPSAEDGENVPATLGGCACRKIAGGKSHYLYVQADDKLVPPGSYDSYLTVEYFDAAPGIAQVEYDRVGKGTAYTQAEDTILLLGTGKWQRAVLRLPEAYFGSRQNQHSDLRLCSPDLAVRRLTLSFTRPAEYREGGSDPALLKQYCAQVGPGVELTFGNDAGPGTAAFYRTLGVTSIESYVTWQTVEDAGKDQWDWSHWDRQVSVLQRSGLKWVPFLIAGPAYATPGWFRNSDQSAPCVCLEHGKPSKVQSIWNPNLRPWVDRFIKEFAARYRDKNVIESLLLGVSGVYGESIYPAGSEGGWTANIPGLYHNHFGWWAGDRYAAASLRRYLQQRYRVVAALNRAWKSDYPSFDAIAPFLPDKAPSLRARADLVAWYTRSMTEWSTFWVATTRKYFPKTEIYLCTGGDGNPMLGADFSAQARAIAPYNAGIRITNEASNYAANFVVTREVATACRAFHTYFGYEPASGVDPNGVIARIYNATASGARQLHYYADNVTGSGEAIASFRAYVSFLQRRSPSLFAGIYLPKTSWALLPETIRPVYDAAATLRERVDVAFVDRATLGNASLRSLRLLALPEAPYLEKEEAIALQRWVANGGILVALADPKRPLFQTPDGGNPMNAFLAHPPTDLKLMHYSLSGKAPRRFVLPIGKGNDADYLFGDWYGQERGLEWRDTPGATKRWSGARPGIHLQIDPRADATLVLDVFLSEHALSGRNEVLVNGAPVGVIDQAGTHQYRFDIPKAVLAGKPQADLTFAPRTWKPSDYGTSDSRELGIGVRSVEICTRGAESEAPGAFRMQVSPDWTALRRHCLRRLGKGAVIVLPGGSNANNALAEVSVQLLQHPERLIPGMKGIPLPAPERDGVFVTRVQDGVLYYNSGDAAIQAGGASVPAHGIAFRAVKAAK